MQTIQLCLLFIVAFVPLSRCINTYHMDVRLNDAVSSTDDDLICQTFEIDRENYQYILEYQPQATSKVAHHLSLYGCTVPGKQYTNKPWRCGQEGLPTICGEGEKESLVYVWANDAPKKTLPEGSGVRIGGDTKSQYLVLQLHYKHKFEEGQTDNSGYILKMTKDDIKKQVGFYILAAFGTIPAYAKDQHMETACQYDHEYDIHPIAYRTHSHHLCRVMSGYHVTNTSWTELGRMSPHAAQFFYDVTTPDVTIKPGDVVASRCTMDSDRDYDTHVPGRKDMDEMCNFYLMYWTTHRDNIKDLYCIRDTDRFEWKTYFHDIPENASSLKGVNYTEIEY